MFSDIQILYTLVSPIYQWNFFLSHEVARCSNLFYLTTLYVYVCACTCVLWLRAHVCCVSCVSGEECSGNNFACASKSCGSGKVFKLLFLTSPGTDRMIHNSLKEASSINTKTAMNTKTTSPLNVNLPHTGTLQSLHGSYVAYKHIHIIDKTTHRSSHEWNTVHNSPFSNIICY